MKKIIFIFLLVLSSSIIAQEKENMLCMGRHWTEDEGNLMLKEFAAKWDDLDSWEDRSAMIKKRNN